MGQLVTGADPGPVVAGGVRRVMLLLLMLLLQMLLLRGNPGPDSGLVDGTGGLQRRPVDVLVMGLGMSGRRRRVLTGP